MKDQIYMQRALTLAALAKGKTATNPMVGSVIVEGGEIIGEGYHREYGKAHAEVNAINSVKDKSRLSRATLYVNLEPCSHYGKTPPCSELIISHSIPRVVIGCYDSYSEVNGRGIKMLRDSGVEVTVGVLERESRELNRRFFTFHQFKRPYIILKWAQTCDGFLDNNRSDQTKPSWLTGERCREIVHKMRCEESAIMVGSRTVVRDNPSLTVRNWSGRNPVRVVIDRELKLSNEYAIFDQNSTTLVVNSKNRNDDGYIHVDFTEPDSLQKMLNELYKRGLCSMIVEGGSTLLNLFISSGLYDEALVFVSPLSLGELSGGDGLGGVRAPILPKGELYEERVVDRVIIKKVIKNSCIKKK